MKKTFTLLITMILYNIGLQAQYDGEVRHWTFDSEFEGYEYIRKGIDNIKFSPGIKEMGFAAEGKTDFLTIATGLDLNDDFTIGFWFHPLQTEKKQTVFLQTKTEDRTQTVERFIVVGIESKGLFIQDERDKEAIADVVLENNVWYFLTYTYDGFEAKLYLQGDEIYSTGKVSMYNKLAQRTDVLHIGKAWKDIAYIEGTIDEITTYNRSMTTNRAKEIYRSFTTPKVLDIVEEDTITKIINEPMASVPAKEEKVVERFHKEDFKGRTNETQYTINVKNTNIELEMWDYDEFDKDKITTSLNNSMFINPKNVGMLLPKKRNKVVLKYNLIPNETNFITFYADDMGEFDSQNTAAVSIRDGKKQLSEVYKLVLTEDKNAVIKLVHTGEEPPVAIVEPPKEVIEPPVNVEKPKEEEPEPLKIVPVVLYESVLEYEILDALVVHSTEVTVEIAPAKKNRHAAYVDVLLDEKSVVEPVNVQKEKQRVSFTINTQAESVITIEASQLLKGEKNRVDVNIISEGKVIATYNLKLEEYNAMIPLAYVEKPGSRRPKESATITVFDTSLTIQVKDYSKIDGDIITIAQGGVDILENYYLRDTLHNVPVQILPNQKNVFKFIPTSMGRADTENTAWVQILIDDKVVHQFSLRSQQLGKASTLTIIHRDREEVED